VSGALQAFVAEIEADAEAFLEPNLPPVDRALQIFGAGDVDLAAFDDTLSPMTLLALERMQWHLDAARGTPLPFGFDFGPTLEASRPKVLPAEALAAHRDQVLAIIERHAVSDRSVVAGADAIEVLVGAETTPRIRDTVRYSLETLLRVPVRVGTAPGIASEGERE
jgi:hypothetical protein